MIRIHTSRLGVYIKNGPRVIFIMNDSPRRPFRTFQHLMEHANPHGGNGIIVMPTTNHYESFASLYTNVMRGENDVRRGDFARREDSARREDYALLARVLSESSVFV